MINLYSFKVLPLIFILSIKDFSFKLKVYSLFDSILFSLFHLLLIINFSFIIKKLIVLAN